MPGVDHYEVCGAQGEWGPPVDCGTGTSTDWDICREGVCIDSPKYAAGFDDVSGWDTNPWPPDTLLLIPVVVENDVRVFELELLTGAGGGFVKMAVWDDRNGYPDKLVIAPDVKNGLLTGAERRSRFPTPKLPELVANRTYWVGAVFSTQATIYSRYNDNVNYLSYNYAFAGDFTDLDPFSSGPAGASAGAPYDVGFSIIVKDLL